MKITGFTSVEQSFFDRSERKTITAKTPYIVVQNFPNLGLLTSLRFLEWVAQNPNGVISLPTGKTPEYFIKWTQYLLANWDKPQAEKIRRDNGLILTQKPVSGRITFCTDR